MKKALTIIVVLLIIFMLGIVFIPKRNTPAENNEPYILRDNYYEETNFAEFIKDPNAVFYLDDFNTKLHSSDRFDYFEIVVDRLYIFKDSYLGDETFGANYEFDKESYGADYEDIALIKSVLVSQGFLEYNGIPLKEGRYFKKSDFILGDGIHVVLGHDYSSFYSLGDTFEIIYFGNQKTAHVVGFVEKGRSIQYGDMVLEFDRAIIAPFEIFEEIYPLDTEKGEYQFKRYLDKNSGILFSEEDKRSIRKEITRLSKESNLLPYQVYGN